MKFASHLAGVTIALFLSIGLVQPALAQQSQIEASAATLTGSDKQIAAFYASVGYSQLWTGRKNTARARALLAALKSADDHGLPKARYQINAVSKALKSRRKADFGKNEIFVSQIFTRYAQDVNSGLLRPSSIDKEIALRPKKISATALLSGISKGNPKAFLANLAPKSADYQNLIKESQRLSKLSGKPSADVPIATIKPNMTHPNVALMRAKLRDLGYGNLGGSNTYDAKLQKVVKEFQSTRGLGADGVVGPATLRAMNLKPADQKRMVAVNMERQRWINFPRAKRYIYVNIPDYSVAIIDNGKKSFTSRTVVGKNTDDTRTPEFIDSMTHMVINPTWHVPASIAGKEYLPIIRKDPGFLRKKNMTMLDRAGNSVNPATIDMASYSENNFPYHIKQRPDPGNALGLVKFMFPNKYNIYLHDTPSKSLFNRETRAYSHGCVRVHKPFEFAYALLKKQSSNPKNMFQTHLKTGKESYVNLKQSVPVIITYQTVVFDDKGRASYRGDIYGRDAKIAAALRRAGVAI
ncbi:murein L,D-transpeptidase [Amylibacter marinus]|uniref:Murein L,D-transpeptidase n=1 Tax=Amylibacter marinus TaxID=1475483 RepID=A0ABQ5VSX5_9RHOB|nr:L,D-transpeptidase family protein [Amylibacter marinus]GLQ34440.1 murein L,D-transpeptidase [Amylibacter marinus]